MSTKVASFRATDAPTSLSHWLCGYGLLLGIQFPPFAIIIFINLLTGSLDIGWVSALRNPPDEPPLCLVGSQSGTHPTESQSTETRFVGSPRFSGRDSDSIHVIRQGTPHPTIPELPLEQATGAVTPNTLNT